MDRSRAARRERVRTHKRKFVVLAAAAVGLLALLVAVAAFGARAGSGGQAKAPERRTEPVVAVVPVSQASTATPVEVPNVTGKTLPEAELVLTCAGFVVETRGETGTAEPSALVVLSQSPAPGLRSSRGEHVSLVLGAAGPGAARPRIVVLDPGHQAKADLAPEPLGPDSRDKKEKITAGATGVATKRQECQVALEISLRMKTRLEAAGVQVLMTRTSNKVDLSNVERAQMANKADADLFVRVHADAATSAKARGVSVMYPGGNDWVKGISADSRRAADVVQAAMVSSTRAPDCGVTMRADLSGFNWSKVPTILIETGNLGNADEDRLLANAGYQDKVAAGAVKGILEYLGR